MVHTHDDDTLFSGLDWASFLIQENADFDFLVIESAVWVLEKTREFWPFAHLDNNLSTPEEQFDSFLERFRNAGYGDEEAVEYINEEMAKLYKVSLRKYRFSRRGES